MGNCCSDDPGGRTAIGGTAASLGNPKDAHNDAVDHLLKSRGYHGLFSQIELSLAAMDLCDRDVLSKSDPMVVVYTKGRDGGLVELGRTEVVLNSLNPKWIAKHNITYHFEVVQTLVFRVYDVDTEFHNVDVKMLKLEEQQFLGEATCALSQIVAKSDRLLTLDLVNREGSSRSNHHQNRGNLIVHAEESVSSKTTIEMTLRCSDLESKDLFSKSDPFLVMSKVVESGITIPVCKTEVIKNDLKPTWKPIYLNFQQVGSKESPLIIECFNFNNNGKHDLLGHSMHLGVLATAWHAITTGTMFTVYYKPRTSPAEFIVPFDQYMESVKNNYSIGMRFKMRFEGEEAPEQRFTGTIIGIEDTDAARWPESKWRSLKVRWDENSTIPRPDRVSSWKIEPALAPPALNPLPVSRPKRPRPNIVPSSSDSSVLTKEGSSKGTADPVLQRAGYSSVLQGQEFSTQRANFVERESDVSHKYTRPATVDDDSVSGSKRFCLGADNWMPSSRHESTYTDLLSGFGTNDDSHGIRQPFVDQAVASSNSVRKHSLDQEGKLNLNSWSRMPSSLTLSLDSNQNCPSVKASYQALPSIRCGGSNDYSVHRSHRVDQPQGNWMMLPPPSHFDQANAREVLPISLPKHDSVRPNDGSCKLFGIPLKTHEPSKNRTAINEPASHEQARPLESDQKLEVSRGLKSVDNTSAVHESDKQISQQHSKDGQVKAQCSSTRSCTKVHKQGIALGRSVDLTKFKNYDELIAELDQLFEFDGELMAPKKNWLLVYTDDENDMMLVGDDPWQEFCGIVRKIFIYTREEVQKMNPGTLTSIGEENPALAAEGVDAREWNSQ